MCSSCYKQINGVPAPYTTEFVLKRSSSSLATSGKTLLDDTRLDPWRIESTLTKSQESHGYHAMLEHRNKAR